MILVFNWTKIIIKLIIGNDSSFYLDQNSYESFLLFDRQMLFSKLLCQLILEDVDTLLDFV